MNADLFELWRKQIPMIDLMGVKPLSLSQYSLENTVKFEPNKNEKNTVLGGSLSSVCALSGWMFCSANFNGANVSIVKQECEFLAPVNQDFVVRISIEPDDLDAVKQKLQARGKSSFKMLAKVYELGSSTVAMQSSLVYVVAL